MAGQHTTKKTGVLLVNLGSPEAPTPSAVRRYLGEFLWDHRVVDLPRVLWWLILHCFVLTFRPRKSARAYQSIWQKKGSPLTYLTRQLTENVALAKQNDAIVVDWAMRYGKPSISQKLQELKAHKVDEILIIPLYHILQRPPLRFMMRLMPKFRVGNISLVYVLSVIIIVTLCISKR
jgi:ferrochelatase